MATVAADITKEPHSKDRLMGIHYVLLNEQLGRLLYKQDYCHLNQ